MKHTQAIDFDPLQDLILAMRGRIDGDELLVAVSVFVDESGTGDEPVIMLAALVSGIDGWLNFNREWQGHLNDAGVDYAHVTEMRKGRGPFKGWNTPRSRSFSVDALKIIRSHCAFGFTVSLNKELYQNAYRHDFPKKLTPDSAYALCAREVFGYSLVHTKRLFNYEGPINFIFESGHKNAANAAQVFEDLKKHSTEAERYGFFALGDKKVTRPLQGSDQIAYFGRRNEAAALEEGTFKEVPTSQYAEAVQSIQGGGCPIFYETIGEEQLEFYRQQAAILRSLKLRQKAKGA